MKVITLIFSALLPVLALAEDLSSLAGSMKTEWPKNRTIRIVFHGHSVPAGFHKTPEVKTFESYPHFIHRKLKERYPFAVISVVTTAIGGENSVSGAARFKRDVLTLRPDLVFIDYALNDRGLKPDEVEAAWMEMITAAREANVPMVLLTPTGDSSADLSDKSDALRKRADLIRNLATREKVILADVSEAWVAELKKGTPEKELLSQKNHPNSTGHKLAAKVIFEALENAGLKP